MTQESNKNCTPIYPPTVEVQWNTFLRSNNQLTGQWLTANYADEACVGNDNKEKGTEKKENNLVFGDSSLCFIRNTIFMCEVESCDGDGPFQARWCHVNVLDHLDDSIIAPNSGQSTFPKLSSRQIWGWWAAVVIGWSQTKSNMRIKIYHRGRRRYGGEMTSTMYSCNGPVCLTSRQQRPQDLNVFSQRC